MNLSKFDFLSFFFILVFGLSSCTKEDVAEITDTNTNAPNSLRTLNNQNIIKGGDDANSMTTDSKSLADCFIIAFPITLSYPDGTTQAFNSEEEFFTALENWYNSNGVNGEPELVFPISITQDGAEQTVESDEEFEVLLEDCFGDDWEGEEDEMEDDEDGDEDNSEDGDEDDSDDGDEDDSDDGDEGDSDDGDAGDSDEDFELCFAVQYPVSITMEDGSILEITTDEEAEELLEETFEGEDDEEDEMDEDDEDEDGDDEFEAGTFTINYPVSVTMDDGTQTSVNSDMELTSLIESCLNY